MVGNDGHRQRLARLRRVLSDLGNDGHRQRLARLRRVLSDLENDGHRQRLARLPRLPVVPLAVVNRGGEVRAARKADAAAKKCGCGRQQMCLIPDITNGHAFGACAG